jgi:hypothetical protein
VSEVWQDVRAAPEASVFSALMYGVLALAQLAFPFLLSASERDRPLQEEGVYGRAMTKQVGAELHRPAARREDLVVAAARVHEVERRSRAVLPTQGEVGLGGSRSR